MPYSKKVLERELGLVCRPKRAMVLLDCSPPTFYKILPELNSYLEGGARKIVVASIHKYIADRVAANTSKKKVPRSPRESSHTWPPRPA